MGACAGVCRYVLKRIRLARLNDWQRQSSFQEMDLVGICCMCVLGRDF